MTTSSQDPIGDIPGAETLVELLRRRSLKHPHRLAYTFLSDDGTEERHLSYRDLDREAKAIASLLQSEGLSGERVLLLYPSGLEYIAAFFGCLYAGATAVTVYPPKSNNSMPRLLSIINNSQAAAAITTDATLSKTGRFFSRAPELKELKWVSADGASERTRHAWREPAVSADTLAMLQYTSGSTTTPKGVMLTHENLMHNQRMIASAFGGGPDSIVVGWLPLYHDMGLIGNVLQPMYLGARCIMMSPVSFLQNPARWLEAISRYRATTSGGPNFAYELCVNRVTPEQRVSLDLSSWRVAFNGAEPIRCRTLEQFASTFGPRGFSREAFYPCYGLAEATLMVTGTKTHSLTALGAFEQAALEQNRVVAASPDEAGTRKLPSCGRPFPNQRIAIVNPDSLAECPPNQVGEIWVSGPNVARGYWGLPDETRRTFGAYIYGTRGGPFLRTGDLGFLMDGELFVTGRLKDVIIIRGRNHYPQDIELTVEQSSPSLQWGRCAAFSVDEGDESRLVVIQELTRNYRDFNLDEVINNIRQAVAEQHDLQVHAVVLAKAGSIPKTTSGKIRRRDCRTQFLADCLKVVAKWLLRDEGGDTYLDAPAGASLTLEAVEDWLALYVVRKLGAGHDEIDRNQPITGYGLDSMGAVELAYVIESRMGISFPAERLFGGGSIATIAAQILHELRDGASRTTIGLQLAPRERPLALSFAQEQFWLLDQLNPGSYAFNIPAVLHLSGVLNPSILRQCFEELTRRHETLRTTFHYAGGQLCQVVAGSQPVPFTEVDLRDVTASGGRSNITRELTTRARLHFDLDKGPLWRATLFHLGDEDAVLLLSMHHIICDGWSFKVLIREISALYRSLLDGTHAGLPPPPIQYADWAYSERQKLRGQHLDRMVSYWTQKLAGTRLELKIPTDYPRPAEQLGRGERVSVLLPGGLSKSLQTMSSKEGVTLFMTLLAALLVLLFRLCEQEDITLVSPVANRDLKETEGVVGCLRNFLVLRNDLSGDPSFRALLLRVRGACLEAYAHHELPINKLINALRLDEPKMSRPLFQVMFAMQKIPFEEMKIPGVTATPIEVPLGVCNRDLNLHIDEKPEGLAASIEYDTSLFKSTRAAAMLGEYASLLERIVADAGQRLSTLAADRTVLHE